MKPLIILDMDGTLYKFDNGNSKTFGSSTFYQRVKENAYSFLSRRLSLSKPEAIRIFEEIRKEFKGEISLGLEKKFGITRYEYFGKSWDLNPGEFLQKKDLSSLVQSLEGEVAVLTAAPRVWAERVLEYLNIIKYISALFTGEPDLRKPNPQAFKQVCDTFGIPPTNAISVGDQIESDILPAKVIGMKTILVGDNSSNADYCIKNIEELPDLIRRINK